MRLPAFLVSAVTCFLADTALAQGPEARVTFDRDTRVFVELSAGAAADSGAVRRVAEQACGGRRPCYVRIWAGAGQAPRQLTMSTVERRNLLAVYRVSADGGRRTFGCHPFGASDQTCAALADRVDRLLGPDLRRGR